MTDKHTKTEKYKNPTVWYTPEDFKAMTDFIELQGMTMSGMVRLAVKELIGESFPNNMPNQERRDYKRNRGKIE